MKCVKVACISVCLAMVVPVMAQESVTTDTTEVKMNWTDLTRLIDKLELGYNQQLDNIKAINICAARGMFYVPTHTVDPQHCKAA